MSSDPSPPAYSSSIPYTRATATATLIAADNASSISGKVVLTTGTTLGGLGATFLSAIAPYSPSLLILAGRSLSKLNATKESLLSSSTLTDSQIRLLELDLASQASVRKAAQEVLAYPEPIDVLVNSAGCMGGPYRTTTDGLEMHLGMNHIGHFLFTNLIMPRILAAPAPRVVNVASDGHRLSGIRFDDPNFSNGETYVMMEAYGQSKTANILFTRSLAAKMPAKNPKFRSYSLHPGAALGTSLAAEGFGEEDLNEVMRRDKEIGWPRGFDWKNLDECSATHVLAAFDKRLDGHNGAYLEDGNLSQMGLWKTVGDGDEERLWPLSEELVGEKFAF